MFGFILYGDHVYLFLSDWIVPLDLCEFVFAYVTDPFKVTFVYFSGNMNREITSLTFKSVKFGITAANRAHYVRL